jgi:signal transduction histidine kinase
MTREAEMDELRTRILLVEDDAVDALLVQRTLGTPAAPGFGFRLYRSQDLAGALARLDEGGIDVVLLDLHLPDSRGAETVARVRERDARVPIVVFTMAGAEEMALRSLQAGAQDYLVKGELTQTGLRRAIRYAIERQRMRDEAERLEERLRQAQKLESLGTLAGGIAHDFNNLLTVILANASLAQRDLPEGSAARSPLLAVTEAARFAARLTDQLLAYSGGASAALEPLDVNAHIREIEGLLRSLLPENVSLELRLEPGLPRVAADASQVQQLVMNLVRNAAEAIGEKPGRILVETGGERVDEETAATVVSGTAIEPGSAVCLAVRDTGCGMAAETAEHVFDPFFTTKITGRGLGLAACHGIVRSHHGALRLETGPGEGTTFLAYFPIDSTQGKRAALPEGGDAQVLVVDDDEALREAARRCLERAGYRVREASSGRAAVALLAADPAAIDLVLLDLTMPDLGGEQTFLALREIQPKLRVLLSSGYDPGEVARRFAVEGVRGFLAKPYDPETLVAEVASVLAAGDDGEDDVAEPGLAG